ncbi:MAG: Y-family DNA polymerase [Bacteroidota bacterium]
MPTTSDSINAHPYTREYSFEHQRFGHRPLLGTKFARIALVDCNNFYVSCERAINPRLRKVPVAVLSSNDGCFIARSQEVKDLGLPMGTPFFKVRDLVAKHHIRVLSANWGLYEEYSLKVMQFLREHAPLVEVYSIDEAFLDLSGMERFFDLERFSQRLRADLLEAHDIPISVGISTSKTLAKLANKRAKKARTTYVDILTDERDIANVLKQTPVDELWGIGRQLSRRLAKLGIENAHEVAYQGAEVFAKHTTIVQKRMQRELQGYYTVPIEPEFIAKQMIGASRSFGKEQHSLEQLRSPIANFVTRACRKLHLQASAAGVISVSLRTNPHKGDQPVRRAGASVRLPTPSAYPPEILRYALQALEEAYVRARKQARGEKIYFKKAGVMLSEITQTTQLQGNLFDDTNRRKIERELALIRFVNDMNYAPDQPDVTWAAFQRYAQYTDWEPLSAHREGGEAISGDFVSELDENGKKVIRAWW